MQPSGGAVPRQFFFIFFTHTHSSYVGFEILKIQICRVLDYTVGSTVLHFLLYSTSLQIPSTVHSKFVSRTIHVTLSCLLFASLDRVYRYRVSGDHDVL